MNMFPTLTKKKSNIHQTQDDCSYEDLKKIASILTNIEKSIPDFFKKFAKKRELKKDDFLAKAGEKLKRIWFIESGILHTILSDEEDEEKEITHSFFFDNEFLGDYSNVICNKPLSVSFRVLSDTAIIWEFNWKKIEQLKDATPFHEIEDLIMNCWFKRIHQRSFLRILKVEEQCMVLYKKNPKYIDEIPVQLLADYIGTSSENLSHIHRKIKKTKDINKIPLAKYLF